MTTSVIIACYNGEKYIIEQLESIKNQTEKVDEVIICDDQSKDNTYSIVEKYINDNKLLNWRIYKNSINKGWKATFADLILEANNDAIFFCDQDDMWYADKVKEMKHAMTILKDRLITSDMDVKYLAEGLHECKQEIIAKERYQHVNIKPIRFRIMRPGCTFLVNTEFAKRCIKELWKDGMPHDLLIWQAAFLVDSIGSVKKPLIEYRRYGQSETAGKTERRIDGRLEETNAILNCAAATLQIEKWDECSQNALKHAKHCINLEKHRKRYFDNGNILDWIKCVQYVDCYLCKRSWLVDLICRYR